MEKLFSINIQTNLMTAFLPPEAILPDFSWGTHLPGVLAGSLPEFCLSTSASVIEFCEVNLCLFWGLKEITRFVSFYRHRFSHKTGTKASGRGYLMNQLKVDRRLMPPQKHWFCGVWVSHQTTLIFLICKMRIIVTSPTWGGFKIG